MKPGNLVKLNPKYFSGFELKARGIIIYYIKRSKEHGVYWFDEEVITEIESDYIILLT